MAGWFRPTNAVVALVAGSMSSFPQFTKGHPMSTKHAYQALCRHVPDEVKARGALVMIVDGHKGTGYAFTGRLSFFRIVPAQTSKSPTYEPASPPASPAAARATGSASTSKAAPWTA